MWKNIVSSLPYYQSFAYFNICRCINNSTNSSKNKFFNKKNIHAKKDPGIRRQLKAYDHEPGDVVDEDLEADVDVFKFDKLYDMDVKNRAQRRETVVQKIVGNKYFKTNDVEKKLSWSDKEHIRYLHNQDSETWTIDVISEQFGIDKEVTRRIATAKWLPKKNKNKEVPNHESSDLVETSKKMNTYENQFPKQNHVKLSRFDEATNNTKKSASEDKAKQYSKQIVTLDELQKKMGLKVNEQQNKPMEVSNLEENSESEDLWLKYTSPNRPSIWKAKESKSPELKVDHSKDSNDMNVYFYDTQHGYQHPFGKTRRSKAPTPLLKVGDDLYQKGDSFYSEDGEFLYCVPGLSK